MKHFRIIRVLALMPLLAVLPEAAVAAPATGSMTLTINGTFKTPVSTYAGVYCSLFVLLTPATPAGGTLANVLTSLVAGSAFQKNAVAGTIKPGGSGFTCSFAGAPYNFANPQPGQQLIIGYEVKASDTSTKPGSTKQLIKTMAIPVSPGVINLGAISASL